MKKFIASVLFLSLLLSLILSVHAVENSDSSVYYYEELQIEVKFNANTGFSEKQKQMIADNLANNTTPPESRAWCWLTGHSYVVDAVTVITHKARVLSPRCLQQTYEVTTCEKCNYYSEDLLGSQYIICCPEE